MKAKEYSKQFLLNPGSEQLAKIAVQFLDEVKELTQKRNAKTDSAVFSIVNELDNKWRAFADQVNKEAGKELINHLGFQFLLTNNYPDVCGDWIKYNTNIESMKRIR